MCCPSRLRKVLSPDHLLTDPVFSAHICHHLRRVVLQTRPSLVPSATADTMGCGMSTEEKEGKQRNEEIENQLKRDKLSQRSEIKMLLLGACARLPWTDST